MTHAPLSPTRFPDSAAIGLRAFPVQSRDKKPAGAWRGYQTEAPNAEELKDLDHFGYNVGLVTGAASGIVAEVLGLTIKALRRWRWTCKGRCHLVDLDRFVQSNRVENSQ